MTVVTEDCNVNTSAGSLHSDMMVVTEDCNVNTSAGSLHSDMTVVTEDCNVNTSAGSLHSDMMVVTEDCNVNTSAGSLHSDMTVVTEDCNVNTHAAQWHASSYWTPTVTDRDWETAIQEVDTHQAWDQLSLQFIANHQLALNNTSTCHITSPYTVPERSTTLH